MPNKLEQLEQEVKILKQKLQKIDANVDDSRFSDRFRIEKKFIIGKNGLFQIEAKDAIPTTAKTGETVSVGGKLLTARADDTFISSGVSVRDIAAGTAADTPTLADTLIRCSTSASQALAITLPEAADSLGLLLVFTFVTDGGTDVTITRAGSDTIDDNAGAGNTTITMDAAGDTIAIMAVQDNIWMVLNNIACVLG